MSRKQLSLNGAWQVIFDPQEKLSLAKLAAAKARAITVPGVWEEVQPGYDGVGWYRRTFDLTSGLLGKRLHLKFGAVNYFAEVFLNGQKVGQHEGGYTPFEFDVTGLCRREGNELAVRVIDPPRTRRIQGFRSGAPLSQSDIPTWKAGWYFNFGGIWQPVEIVATEQTYVDDIFVQPQPDLKTVKFDVDVMNHGGAARYEVAVTMKPRQGDEATGAAVQQTVRLKKGHNKVTLSATVSKPHLWSCEDPFLYTATATVSAAGVELDSVAVKCGLRLFTVEDGVFKLNGKRIALRGFLQQGVYPRHIVFPENAAAARKELELVKKSGMNFIRAHLKPSPIHLDFADEMGILILAEPPIGWIENTEFTLGRCKTEIDELVRRDRNRPAVVMWGLLNEATHYRTFTPAQLEKFKSTISEHCRRLDPTRLVIDNSGGDLGGHEKESSVGVHVPFGTKPVRMHDLHAYCGLPLSVEALRSYRGHGGGHQVKPDGETFVKVGVPSKKRSHKNDQVVFISEFGAFENPPDFTAVIDKYTPAERKLGLEDYQQHQNYYDSLQQQFKRAQLGEIFGTLDKYVKAQHDYHREHARAILSAMRANPRNSGWCFTQLADASGELFGATDIWRRPRPWLKEMVEACRTPLIVPHITQRVVAPGTELGLNVRIVNEDQVGVDYHWKVTVRGADGRPVYAKGDMVRAKGWVQEVLDTSFAAPSKAGRYTVEADLRGGSKTLSTNTIRFTVIEPMSVGLDRVGMFDMENEIRPALEAIGVAQVDKGGNNYRHKDNVCVYVPRAHHHLGLLSEYNQQLRRIVNLGGVAVVLEGLTPMMYPELLPSLVKMKSPMRNMIYMRPSPIWQGLPTSGGLMDYEFADVLAGRSNARTDPEDVLAAGGKSISGGLCAHMWTGPEVYEWGSFIDVIPVGRGHIILCQFCLVQPARTNVVAQRLLGNLLKYAKSLIKPGGAEKLLSRCIDPIK